MYDEKYAGQSKTMGMTFIHTLGYGFLDNQADMQKTPAEAMYTIFLFCLY